MSLSQSFHLHTGILSPSLRPFIHFRTLSMRVACLNVVVGRVRINGKETPFHMAHKQQ